MDSCEDNSTSRQEDPVAADGVIPIPPPDYDGDGLPSLVDTTPYGEPSSDIDRDGIPDQHDLDPTGLWEAHRANWSDRDNDEIPNVLDSDPDRPQTWSGEPLRRDGSLAPVAPPSPLDPTTPRIDPADLDGDGVPNSLEALDAVLREPELSSWEDFDRDGIANWNDRYHEFDRDLDTIPDSRDPDNV